MSDAATRAKERAPACKGVHCWSPEDDPVHRRHCRCCFCGRVRDKRRHCVGCTACERRA